MAKKSPVVIVRRNGREYLRSRPGRYELTPASRQTATTFGSLSALASQLVVTFKPIIPVMQGQHIYHRLLSALVNCKQRRVDTPGETGVDGHYLNGFRFVKKASLGSKLKLDFETRLTAGVVEIQLPSFIPANTMVAPGGCKHIQLDWMAVACNPDEAMVRTCSRETITYSYDNTVVPATMIQLAVAEAAPLLVLLAVTLRYDNIITGMHAKPACYPWMPGGIVRSWYLD